MDFAYVGAENGSFRQPSNTMAEGIDAVPMDGSVIVKGGTNSFSGNVTKALTLRSLGSPITLGQ